MERYDHYIKFHFTHVTWTGSWRRKKTGICSE